MKSTTLFILSTSMTYTSAFTLSSTGGSHNTVAMNMNTQATATATPVPTASALAEAELELEIDDERFLQKKQEVYDPLGLYPQYSPERLFDSIQPLESSSDLADEQQDKTIIDPLNIYQDKSQLSSDVVMSASLPFLKRPANLNGRLPGDRGFDPLNFSSNMNTLNWYRESELKHGRLAMLATVGWVISELTHNSLASTFGVDSIVGSNDQVPSVLNGGLEKVNPLFWLEVVCVAAVLEFVAIEKGDNREPGNFSFDPFQLSGRSMEEKFYVQESEIFNGRLAMLAITGFAIQEYTTHDAVIHQTPIFFNTISNVVAHHFYLW